jgi:hypothetical protein
LTVDFSGELPFKRAVFFFAEEIFLSDFISKILRRTGEINRKRLCQRK